MKVRSPIFELYDRYLDRFHERVESGKFLKRTVLDVGCGEGNDALIVKRYARRVTGIDIAPSRNWSTLRKNGIRCIVGNAEKIPFKNNMFTGIFLKDVLHHVDNPESVLREIRRVTRKGARIVLIEANRYNPIFYIHMTKMLGHEHFSKHKFQTIIRKYFPNAQFRTIESHFIPILHPGVHSLTNGLIETFFNLPGLRHFQSYNIAEIQKL